jgi:hypothetical protein
MIKKSIYKDEIIAEMQKQLFANTDQSKAIDSLPEAINMLHSAADLLDDVGLSKHSNKIFTLLTKIANSDQLDSNDDELNVKDSFHLGKEFNLANNLDDLLMADIEERDSIEKSEVFEDFEDE